MDDVVPMFHRFQDFPEEMNADITFCRTTPSRKLLLSEENNVLKEFAHNHNQLILYGASERFTIDEAVQYSEYSETHYEIVKWKDFERTLEIAENSVQPDGTLLHQFLIVLGMEVEDLPALSRALNGLYFSFGVIFILCPYYRPEKELQYKLLAQLEAVELVQKVTITRYVLTRILGEIEYNVNSKHEEREFVMDRVVTKPQLFFRERIRERKYACLVLTNVWARHSPNVDARALIGRILRFLDP